MDDFNITEHLAEFLAGVVREAGGLVRISKNSLYNAGGNEQLGFSLLEDGETIEITLAEAIDEVND